MYRLKQITVFLLLQQFFLSESCEYGLVPSAWDESCVEPWVVLIGGRNMEGWRRDGEIWGTDGRIDVQFPNFPYAVDAPFGWWTPLGLLVCGGQNWDDDVTDDRCWLYDQCEGSWHEEAGLRMPYGLLGGGSIHVANNIGEEFWAVGGSNGSALPYTQVLRNVDGDWTWQEGPQLNVARYSHCAVLVQESVVVIIGGHDNDNGILESVEVFDLTTGSISLVDGLSTHRKRWGGVCFSQPDQDGEEEILMIGGMDQFFIPHANMDILNPSTYVWRKGPDLPRAQSGALGTLLGGAPTFFGGFHGLGFSREVVSFIDNLWKEWTDVMDTSRISGLAVNVPKDIYDYC